MALFILFCDVTAELTNQELRFGLKIPLVVIANGAQNSNLSKIFGSLLFSYRMGPLVDSAIEFPFCLQNVRNFQEYKKAARNLTPFAVTDTRVRTFEF